MFVGTHKNKKNIVNDKEKLEAIKKLIDGLNGQRGIVPMASVIDKIELMFYGYIRRNN